MKKSIFSFFLSALLMSTSLCAGIYESNSGYIFAYQQLVYDNFFLPVCTPAWQPRVNYSGLLPSSIGYFYVNSWDGDIGIYGSNRYVPSDDAEAFYQSLQPLEANLLPYATPNATGYTTCKVLTEEDSFICNIPAKKVVIELDFPDKPSERITSYVFTSPRTGIFSNSIMGYTYSVSCYTDKYEEQKEQIDALFTQLKIR